MKDREVLAIIPARGGSKRIPKKNIKSFEGKPIIAYSIEAARESRCFSEIMVSTDSEEIAEVARRYGAEVPFLRSDNTSGDYATMSDVLLEVLGKYGSEGRKFTEVCCLFPTAPFITPEKLRTAARILEREEDKETVLPVVRFSYPPQRGLYIKDGYLQMSQPEHSGTRSQDLKPMYHDAGQFLFFRTEGLFRTKDLMLTQLAPMVVSELEVQDIDDETDWALAEAKYRLMKRK